MNPDADFETVGKCEHIIAYVKDKPKQCGFAGKLYELKGGLAPVRMYLCQSCMILLKAERSKISSTMMRFKIEPVIQQESRP